MSDSSMSTTPDDGIPVEQQVDSLSRMVENLERRLATVEDERDSLQADLDALRDDLQAEREQREQLSRELERRTSLLARADEMDGWDTDKFAAYIVQKLATICREEDYKRQWVDAATAWDWVNRMPDRTTMYDIFRKAEALSDGPVQYIDEPRGADPPSRLELDLSAGDLPRSVGQHAITVCGDATTENGAVGGASRGLDAPESHGGDT